MPTSRFLHAAVEITSAEVGLFTLIRPDFDRRVLVTVDQSTYNLHAPVSTLHRQNVVDLSAWEGDPLMRRLVGRIERQPAGFTYRPNSWIRRFGWHGSHAAKTLQAAGWGETLSALTPIDPDLWCVLTVAWRESHHASRLQGRLLLQLAAMMRHRVSDVRARRLRGDLPASLRRTFELILQGSTEKEIAAATRRKINTIHDHIKRLYSHFGVNSRAQLMARFIDVERLKKLSI